MVASSPSATHGRRAYRRPCFALGATIVILSKASVVPGLANEDTSDPDKFFYIVVSAD